MSLLFLIPLVIGLATARLSQQAADDLAEILSVASVSSLVLGLVLALWQMLLIMMMVLFSTKKVLP